MIGNHHISYQAEAWDILQYLFEVKKMNNHTLHFVTTFLGKLDLEQLKKAVNLSAYVFPLIRCRFTESGGHPCWEDCGYTAKEMITYLETNDLDESVDNFICTEVDALVGPQVKLRVIRSENNDTLAVLMNHMLCDAAGFKDYLYMLSDIYSNLEENPNYCPKLSGNRNISQILKSFSMLSKIKILTSKNDMSTHDPAKFELDGDPNTPFIVQRKILRETFCQLKTYAKKHDATVNDIMLSAYIRSLNKTFGHAVAIPCTVDLRKYLVGHKADGICNLCTNLSCNIGQDISTMFEQTLDKVKHTMDKEKSSIACLKSIALLEKLFDILSYRTAKGIVVKNFSNPQIAFTNIGIIDTARLSFGEIKITEAYMTGSVKYAPYFQLAISTYDNQATLSINLYGTHSDRNRVSSFLDSIVWELQSVV